MRKFQHIQDPQRGEDIALCGVTVESEMAIPLVDEIVSCQECMRQDWNLVCAEAATWD